MKKELIVTAKTVDEAKEKAALELGVAVENIEFTVLDEGKRGFHRAMIFGTAGAFRWAAV